VGNSVFYTFPYTHSLLFSLLNTPSLSSVSAMTTTMPQVDDPWADSESDSDMEQQHHSTHPDDILAKVRGEYSPWNPRPSLGTQREAQHDATAGDPPNRAEQVELFTNGTMPPQALGYGDELEGSGDSDESDTNPTGDQKSKPHTTLATKTATATTTTTPAAAAAAAAAMIHPHAQMDPWMHTGLAFGSTSADAMLPQRPTTRQNSGTNTNTSLWSSLDAVGEDVKVVGEANSLSVCRNGTLASTFSIGVDLDDMLFVTRLTHPVRRVTHHTTWIIVFQSDMSEHVIDLWHGTFLGKRKIKLDNQKLVRFYKFGDDGSEHSFNIGALRVTVHIKQTESGFTYELEFVNVTGDPVPVPVPARFLGISEK
jgi:Fas apoptotic inhibitory molecule (FAIM1)